MIQAQLSLSYEVSFFTSNVPVHVAAMVIIFGSISNAETLDQGLAKEDVQLALKLIPLFRWRWQRQDDLGAAHAVISRLASKVYKPFVVQQGPLSPPILLAERLWLSDAVLASTEPPRIEDIFGSVLQSGSSRGLGVGLGDDSVREFVTGSDSQTAAEATAALGAAMDLDHHHAGVVGPRDDEHDIEGVENLLTGISDHDPTENSIGSHSANGNGAFVPGDGGYVLNGGSEV